jgi:hypothetical protein
VPRTTAPTTIAPTAIAVDWSGAKRPAGIWLAAVRDGELVDSRPVSTREAAIDLVLSHEPPVVAGFDFSFGLPAWFAHEHGCSTIDDVWTLAAKDGETWLRPTAPFWRVGCDVPLEKRFRNCERRFPSAKSVFQLVGNGQVGAGSVRGMPLLARLRAAGFAIWPFDNPRGRIAMEIYPSALRVLAPDFDGRAWRSLDERDAVVSAHVLWRHRGSVATLQAATDPVTRLEGDVWMPPAPSAPNAPATTTSP